MQTGWVYRSDAGRGLPEPTRIDPVWTAPAAEPVWTARTHEPSWPESRDLQPAPRPTRGWIETGLYLMALPVALPMAITAGLMLAPVIWIFGSRPRR